MAAATAPGVVPETDIQPGSGAVHCCCPASPHQGCLVKFVTEGPLESVCPLAAEAAPHAKRATTTQIANAIKMGDREERRRGYHAGKRTMPAERAAGCGGTGENVPWCCILSGCSTRKTTCYGCAWRAPYVPASVNMCRCAARGSRSDRGHSWGWYHTGCCRYPARWSQSSRSSERLIPVIGKRRVVVVADRCAGIGVDAAVGRVRRSPQIRVVRPLVVAPDLFASPVDA